MTSSAHVTCTVQIITMEKIMVKIKVVIMRITLYEIDNLNIWTINTVGVCVLIRIGEKDFLNCNCFYYENVPRKL